MNSWRVPTDNESESSNDPDSSASTDDIPLVSVVSTSNQLDAAPHLPLVLMFMNKTSEASILPALQPVESAWDKEEVTTPRIVTNDSITSKLNLVVPDVAENQVNGAPTPKPNNDDQISPTMKNQIVVLDKEDSVLQAQLAFIFNATIHADKTSSTIVQSTSSSTTSRIPTRKAQGPKRPRPSKPSSGSKTSATTATTSTTTATSIPAEDENRMTTSEPLTSSTMAESFADQQANVLQFLVSNPPAWVLDEIINGSTLTTWFPLPIPGTAFLIYLIYSFSFVIC